MAVLRILSALAVRAIALGLGKWGLHLDADEMFALYLAIETGSQSLLEFLKSKLGVRVVEKVKDSLRPSSHMLDADDRPSLVELVEELERERKKGVASEKPGSETDD